MMELITQMTESQKLQEMKLDELKSTICRLHDEHQRATADKEVSNRALKEAEENLANLTEKYENLRLESSTSKEQYFNELNAARKHCIDLEHEMKTTYEHIVNEMRNLEDKNHSMEEDLRLLRENLKVSTARENALVLENEKFKAAVNSAEKKYTILRLENEKTSNNLHDCKMQLLKERNVNDRLTDEMKRLKKELNAQCNDLNDLKNEKESLNQKIAFFIQAASKERLLETELRELKALLNIVLMSHNSMEEKVSSLHVMLKGETASVGTQTEVSNSDLNKYENLDREATMMMVGLREQIVNLKQKFFESRQENEALKGLVHESKRNQELREETERVARLEDAVKSLSNKVRQEFYEPTRDSCIIQALMDVKKDLDALKSRANTGKFYSHEPDQSGYERPVKLVTCRNVRQ